MGANLIVRGFTDKTNPEFQRHFKAVKFCIENGLSFPKETSEFFKDKIQEGDLEGFSEEYILGLIENGIAIEIPISVKEEEYYEIKVADIPKECATIIACIEA